MSELLGLICSAIAREEGWWVIGSRPKRNNNPGDLRAAPWLPKPQMDGNYWKADSVAQGIAGLYHQVALDIARGYSLRQLITAWAPASDGNDTEVYIAAVMSATTITDSSVPLWTFLTLDEPT